MFFEAERRQKYTVIMKGSYEVALQGETRKAKNEDGEELVQYKFYQILQEAWKTLYAILLHRHRITVHKARVALQIVR